MNYDSGVTTVDVGLYIFVVLVVRRDDVGLGRAGADRVRTVGLVVGVNAPALFAVLFSLLLLGGGLLGGCHRVEASVGGLILDSSQ